MDKARKPYPTKARERIQTGMILERLDKHVLGELEMTSTQIQAARILLSKTLPDLTHQENATETVMHVVVDKNTAKDIADGVCAAIRKS